MIQTVLALRVLEYTTLHTAVSGKNSGNSRRIVPSGRLEDGSMNRGLIVVPDPQYKICPLSCLSSMSFTSCKSSYVSLQEQQSEIWAQRLQILTFFGRCFLARPYSVFPHSQSPSSGHKALQGKVWRTAGLRENIWLLSYTFWHSVTDQWCEAHTPFGGQTFDWSFSAATPPQCTVKQQNRTSRPNLLMLVAVGVQRRKFCWL